MDLIFHIGLTKTGSSFLQEKVFKGKIRTMDRSIGYDNDTKLALDFQNKFLTSNENTWKQDESKIFFKSLQKSSQSNTLISHETLHDHIPFINSDKHIKLEPKELASRLESINKYCWPYGKVKVFFFFRKQSEWLASIYSHVAYKLKNPSQKHFEDSVRDILCRNMEGEHCLNYFNLHKTLSHYLGAENVLAIPYEAMSKKVVWDRLNEFTGINFEHDQIPFNDYSVNTKRDIKEGVWKPSGFSTKLRENYIIKNFVKVIPNRAKFVIRNFVKKVFKPNYTISLTSETKKSIEEHYKESNILLRDVCEFDIQEYGF